MSAVKLEKKVAALEKRLQDEMHAALEPLVQRLDQLEEHLRNVGGPLQSLDSTPTPKVEPMEGEADLSGIAVVPQPSRGAEEEGAQIKVGNWTKAREREDPVVPKVREVSEEEEPIPFAETIWNVVLVLGHSGAGWVDVMVATFLTCVGTFMQAIFVAVILSDSFLGDRVEDQVEAARQWRAGSAHDVKHMDLAMTSLVSRVCSGDGSLILSTGQADLISEINQFLGIPDGGIEPQMAAPGTTLCMLCIALWCVVLGGELRAIATSLVAAAQIPRSRKTVLEKGSFLSISYGRFASYLFFRAGRTVVAGCLLIAGVQWLARTSSITDLILNAVALEAILQIDEMIFACLFPKKVQAAIYELEPVKIRYSRRGGHLESCLIVLFFTTVVLVPFFLWVQPITDMMLAVKLEYCGGNQDFVVSLNQEVQMYMAFDTVPYDNISSTVLGQLAVMEQSKGRLLNGTTSKYLSFASSLDTFESNRFKTMQAAATQFPFCLDFDSWSVTLQATYGAHFRAAAVQLGNTSATSCADLAAFCDEPGARLLRLVCGRTCGCADPTALPWFKVPSQGCSMACRQEALAAAADLPCSDANTTENWQKFWEMYPTVMSSIIGQDLLAGPEGSTILKLIEMMDALGCVGLGIIGTTDVATSSSWCEGSPQFFGPLALICPRACGCNGAGTLPTYCSDSCRSCGDAETFPANPVASNCAEAKVAGICDVASEAAALCSETCGLCNGTANATIPTCQDAAVPPELLPGMDCQKVQALGWCGPLIFLSSPISRICAKSCGLCK